MSATNEAASARSEFDWHVADALQVFVMMANADGTVTSFNESWHAYTGQPHFASDAERQWMQYMHPDDREPVARGWAAAVEAGQRIVDMEYRLREAATGEYRWFRARATALSNEHGAVERWVGVALDVDEEHRKHATLETLYDRARTVAATMQRASLPSDIPNVEGVSFKALYLPSVRTMTIGGDWYDAFALPDGGLAISIGDVPGPRPRGRGAHGRDSLQPPHGRASARRRSGRAAPDSTLESVEQALRSEHRDASATAFLGIVAPDRATLRYTSAGHPPPLFVHARRYLVLGARRRSPAGLAVRHPAPRARALARGHPRA